LNVVALCQRPARSTYSDEQRAEALAALDANGGNQARTARQLGVPRGTLRRWARPRGVSPAAAQVAHQNKGSLADRLEELAFRILDSITADKIRATPLLPLMKTLALAVDLMLVLRGPGDAFKANRAAGNVSRARPMWR
jgi:hypothetical protein